MQPAMPDYMALMRAFKRLLWRAALLAWISFFPTAESMQGWASLYAASADVLSPA